MSWWQSSTPVGDSPNLTKFLDFLSQAEGADYNTIVGGGRFNSFDAHPGIVGLRTKEGPSTAAGRYQITKTTYDDVAPRLGIRDFSPQSQDAIAIELIRRGGAFDDVVKGDFETAINKLGRTWASLPSSPYSQPKLSWDRANQMLGVQVAANKATDNWWAGATPVSDASSGENWWSGATPVDAGAAPVGQPSPARPAPASSPARPAQAAPAAPAPAAPQPSVLSRIGRGVDDFVRGAADTLTFGYADEIAARMDSLFGGGQSGRRNYNEALAAQRQRDSEGGAARIAGQVGGALLPAGVAIQSAAGATRAARAGAGAATGAIQGGLYGTGSAEGDLEDRLKQGAVGAGVGALAGGALSAVLPVTRTQQGNRIIRAAGGDDAAKMDAEIIKDISNLAKSETQRGNPLTAVQLNAVENKYINDVNSALTKLRKTGVDVTDVKDAIQNRRALTPDDLEKLRGTAAGDAAADAILKAQRIRSLTQPSPSTAGILPAVREVNRWLLPERFSTPLNAVLGGRQTREVAAQRALKNADGAENVLQRLGPSAATESMDALNAQVARLQQARQAQAAAQQAARQAAQQTATQNRIQVLQDTRRPLSGAFQELLPGGRSNLNLSSDEAINALRLTARQFKDRPVGQAAQDILRSGNVADESAFYGLQNQLRKLQEQGVLSGQPGALSAASSVRNPISYAEAVRTAGEAANLARANAPSKELAQFATRVAGIKSPADKAKAVADRLAKTTDPTEQAFLTQFVEPLAQFGKK